MVNKAILVGHLGREPELKSGEYTRCILSVATSRKWQTDAGEKKDETTWHKVVVWGRLGEICAQYLAKGRQVYVEGRIRNYVVGEGDDKRYFHEIVAQTVQFLGRSTNGNGNGDAKEDDPESADVPF